MRMSRNFYSCRGHSDFTLCPSWHTSSARKSERFLESLDILKRTLNNVKRIELDSQFSVYETVPDCLAYNHWENYLFLLQSSNFKILRKCQSKLDCSNFQFLRKCQSKLNCLIFEMFNPRLSEQNDSIRAKLFV